MKKVFRKKMLASLQAFFPDDKEIIEIINLCDLHPVDGWRIWENEYFHFIKIQDDKIVVPFKKALGKFISKDIYLFSSIEDILPITNKLFLIIENKNIYHFLLWGYDILRYRKYDCKSNPSKWVNCHPLDFSLELIREFIRHKNVRNYQSINIIKPEKSEGWVTVWPPTDEFFKQLKDERCINLLKSLAVAY